MADFTWGQFGVCNNPNTYGPNIHNNITTAYHKDTSSWYAGYSLTFRIGCFEGSYSGVSLHSTPYKTERDAVNGTIKTLRERRKKTSYTDDQCKEVDEFIEYVYDLFNQLELELQF